MARESSAIVGSGISALREQQDVRSMRGSNAVITNYEDVNSCLGVVQSTARPVGGITTQLTLPAYRLRGRRKIIVQNLGSDNVFIGGADVSTSNGLRLGSGEKLELDVLDFGDIWVVSDGSADVRVLEIR
jgi:hypothetical protein